MEAVELQWEATSLPDGRLQLVVTLIDNPKRGLVERCEEHDRVTRILDPSEDMLYDLQFRCPECYRMEEMNETKRNE